MTDTGPARIRQAAPGSATVSARSELHGMLQTPTPRRTPTQTRDYYAVRTPEQTGNLSGRATLPSKSFPSRLVDRRSATSVWVVLSLWTVAWSVVQAVGGMYSWHYFATGGTALLQPGGPGGGLHVYAAHPDLQMGPLTLVVAALVVAISGPFNAFVAALVMTGLGALTLRLLVALRAQLRHEPVSSRTTLYCGLLLIPAWSVLSIHYGHLDDVLALTLTTGAVVAVSHHRPWLTVVLLAAAAGAKPWALPFAVLVLMCPTGRARRVACYAALCALPWLPFLAADHKTTSISSFTIANAPDSALRAFGVTTAQTPSWDRGAQLLLAIAIALWCLRINRAFAIPAVVLTIRMLLDPGTNAYYTCGLIVACLYVDLTDRHRRVPWTTAAVTAWFAINLLPASLLPSDISGDVRAAFLLALLITLTVPADSLRTIRRRMARTSDRAIHTASTALD